MIMKQAGSGLAYDKPWQFLQKHLNQLSIIYSDTINLLPYNHNFYEKEAFWKQFRK